MFSVWQSATEQARAKVNLLLAVGHKRADSYHDLVSVMQTVDVCDTVTVTAHTGSGITMTCDDPSLPADSTNLAYRAAEVFFARTGLANAGVHIELQKRLPMQAGLGGGSADGAAVLRGLRTLYAPDLTDAQLETMAADLGSDVPFCVRGGTALALGRGEQLSPLPQLPDCWFVLVKPEESFSTGKMYQRIDELGCYDEIDPSSMTAALTRGDLAAVCAAMENTFEKVVPADSTVPAIRERLLSLGAMGAMLSGSGSSVFGIFDEESAAKRAAEAMKAEYPRTFLARNW